MALRATSEVTLFYVSTATYLCFLCCVLLLRATLHVSCPGGGVRKKTNQEGEAIVQPINKGKR